MAASKSTKRAKAEPRIPTITIAMKTSRKVKPALRPDVGGMEAFPMGFP